MSLRIGVDIGPDAPGSEVLAGIEQLKARHGLDPAQVSYFTHGTTVGVNAVVQRRGLKLALITTRNFEDVLDIGRLKIPDMYHLMSKRPAPLISRDRVFGVDERLGADGSVVAPVREAGCEGVVVSLLHAYRNPAHERQVKAILQRALPGMFVSCSHEVWPIIREYERTLTATIGGYVQPRVSHYLESLQGALRESGVPVDLKVTKSNGGVMSAEHGKANCVQMILSGTASGVIGAAYIADLCHIPNCMSLDIGGTTADIALIVDGKPQFATGEYIGDFQIHIPSVSVSSVGDGGGSIAWVDELGVLKVGPQSAGSTPGPVCYGKGGTQPTITDAFAVMGVIGSQQLGYNAVQVDVEAARRSIEPLAEKLGTDVLRTAEAIVNVSVSSMYAGVSRVISRFGIDPRVFSLMPFGGAGPMLACYLAKALKVQKLLVPTTPGVLSALGGLIADVKNDFVRTTYCDLNAATVGSLAQAASELEAQARAWLVAEVGTDADAEIDISADMRYRGQSFEIDTPVERAWLEAGAIDSLSQAFHKEHERLYGHGDASAGVQVVAMRLVITSRTPKPELNHIAQGAGVPPRESTLRIWLEGQYRDVPLYRREKLLAGQAFSGPAIVAQDDCTTCVLPGFDARVDTYGNLELTALALN